MNGSGIGWLKRPKLWQFGGGLLALLLVIYYLAGGFHPKTGPGAVDDAAARTIPPGAPTLTVAIETIRPVIAVVGTIRSEEHVNLSSRLNAYVARVAASAGDRVRAGQVLIELDDRDLRQQQRAAEADLASAEAEHRRTEELFRSEAATRRQLDAAESAHRSAQARLEEAEIMLSHARIAAPAGGVVVERRVEVGDLATVGSVLLTLYDPGRMRLEAPVPLRLADRLRYGERLEVEIDTGRELTGGVVGEIVAAVDPQSRTRLVKVLLPGASGKVLPGMFGRLHVPGDPREAVLVPSGVVYRVGQLPFVQIGRDGKVLRRAVRLGAEHAGRVEILSGLAAGETILLEPIHAEG
jgi:RND family efflux transporter MFP subunit